MIFLFTYYLFWCKIKSENSTGAVTLKEKIKQYAKTLGLTEFGVSSPDRDKTALVFLFPYYTGSFVGTISLYAQSTDYHYVVRQYLLKICSFIKLETSLDFSKNIFCDISPYNDREVARMAGLGFYGKNHMLINPRLGSYFFIGYIITEGLPLELDSPLECSCADCGKCVNICPGRAITENGFCKEKCASDISQKKGELSAFEENILKKSGYIWGCDKCQSVCPHNENLPCTPIAEFKGNLLTDLCLADLKNLSEREFKEKYNLKAFTWRGKQPLLRNIELLKK